MATASRFDLSVLEHAQKVPGKPRHKTREVRVGDKVYGGLELRGDGPKIAGRQLLHARRLGFAHPRTGETVSVESPIPQDFQAALAALRRQSALGPAHAREPRTPDRRGQKKAPARPALSKSRRGLTRQGR